MRLSIVICTHNRAAELNLTLASLARLPELQAPDIEVLVVANAVSDDTMEVCRRAGIACAEEPRLGLSHARNTGIRLTRGQAILWLDDDVTAEPCLLRAYLDALETHPDAAFFGGVIIPELIGAPPPWTRTALQMVPTIWAARDLGDTARDFDTDRHEYPFGANMLTRRWAVRDGFRTDLGRTGTDLMGGEEIALFRSLVARGSTGRWVPGARVVHRIGPERQTLRYLARYFVAQGRERGAEEGRVPGSDDPTWLQWRMRIERMRLSYLRGRLANDPRRWLRPYVELNKLKGWRQGYAQSRRGITSGQRGHS